MDREGLEERTGSVWDGESRRVKRRGDSHAGEIGTGFCLLCIPDAAHKLHKT